MKRKQKQQLLDLIKINSSFYETKKGVWLMETSVNISDPDLINALRKFFTED